MKGSESIGLMIKQFDKLKSNMVAVSDNILESQYANDIIILNKKTLSDGYDSRDEELKSGKRYAPYTIEIKKKFSRPTFPYNLHDTGTFYNSIFLEKVAPGQHKIDSKDDIYVSKLQFKHPFALGLDDYGKAKIRELLFIQLKKIFKSYFA